MLPLQLRIYYDTRARRMATVGYRSIGVLHNSMAALLIDVQGSDTGIGIQKSHLNVLYLYILLSALACLHC